MFLKISHKPFKSTLFISVLIILGISLLYGKGMVLSTGIKSETQSAMGVEATPTEIKLAVDELSGEYISPVFETNFEFNAIAPHWEESLSSEENRQVAIRVSEDGNTWTEWMELEVGGPVRNNDPKPDRAFPETPLFIEGSHYQYRIELERGSLSQKSPRIKDLKVNYIDSRKSLSQKITEKIKSSMGKVFASDSGPQIISREDWGSPDPYGDKFHGTHRYWRPAYAPTEQIFLHHTVTESVQSDPEAVMQAIWDYHANTRGWGDIGYNYVLDHEGNIYEGRFGGDNVTAGHVFGYNQGSLGVAVLGCFQPDSSICNQLNNGSTTQPTEATINSLVNLLSWKTTSFEIDPEASHSFCNSSGNNCLNLPTIAAHRDAGDTSCNGQLFYDMSSAIRQDVAEQNNQTPWAYSAKQSGFEVADLRRNSRTDVTLSFKNTGTQEWTNTTNRMLLKTAKPTGRISKFEGEDWIDSQTPAALNESSVLPGEIGSFTFEVVRPPSMRDRYLESFKIVSENNAEIESLFGLTVNTIHPDDVYRMYSPHVKRHFYTRNANERNRIVSLLGFRYEGVGFRGCDSTDGSFPPVYRLYHPGINKHFFTRSSSERDHVVDELGYVYEGVAWRSCNTDSSPVYRLYNHYARNHFYTRSANERDYIIENLGFTLEGTGFWAK